MNDRMRSARVALVTLAVLASIGPTSRSDEPNEADRAAIEKLAGAIIERIDAAKSLVPRRAEAEVSERRARADLDEAERSANVATISVSEYLQGTFPQEEQTILGDIKLAESDLARATDRLEWSDKVRNRGIVSDAENLADKMAHQKCQIALAKVKTSFQVLQTFSKKKQITELEANVKKAEAVVVMKQAAFAAAKAALADLDRRVAESAPNGLEKKAIVALDDAIATFDAGDAAKGRERLASAETMWREAQAVRALERFRSMKRKIRMEADAVRAAK